MILAVLFILVQVGLLAWPSSIYLWHQFHELPLQARHYALMGSAYVSAAVLSVLTCCTAMQRGIRALEAMG
jgi:hypothetical protein